VRIQSKRNHKEAGKIEREIRYYITSLKADAARLNSAASAGESAIASQTLANTCSFILHRTPRKSRLNLKTAADPALN
jgi:hypothetical protein